MSEQSGLYDRITIGGETFRRWHSSPELQVMQDGAWTSIPYVANRAILAMIENMNAAIAAEREECAKIADAIAERWYSTDEKNGGPAAEEVAAAIRSRSNPT